MNQANLRGGTSRELELELVRVRAEAAAVRLEARAAEIELLLLAQSKHSDCNTHPEESPARASDAVAAAVRPSAQLPVRAAVADGDDPLQADALGAESVGFSTHHRVDAAEALLAAIRQLISDQQCHDVTANAPRAIAPGSQLAEADSQPAEELSGGWQARLEGLRQRSADQATGPEPDGPAPEHANKAPEPDMMAPEPGRTARQSDAMAPQSDLPASLRRVDEKAQTVARPQSARRLRVDPPGSSTASGGAVGDSGAVAGEAAKRPEPSSGDAVEASDRSRGKAVKDAVDAIEIVLSGSPRSDSTGEPPAFLPAEVELSEEEVGEPARRRIRPTGWLASTMAHIVVLVLLGLMTLSAQKPRDQLAFSASASEAAEDVMETFTIESSETVPEESQPQAAETQLEISPIGTMQVAELAIDPPAAPPPVSADLLSSSASSLSSLTQATEGDAQSKVQFAGVDGGGNHFIYLVDSSKSMRNFHEARMELLRSVESLQNHQRFYVVFYDQEPDYMRLSDAQRNEPNSVLATDHNKLALRRWAMTIQQQRGKSPIDVLPFAFNLRPDVVFLLSDGEFSGRTEEVIGQHNRQDNLFGEDGPLSIIHTIRYPGFSAGEARNAEVQMKRIAAENGGQYRNVEIN